MAPDPKPRILYLTHRVPHPPDKGDRIRNYHVLRELAKVASVTLISLADEPVTAATRIELASLCARVEIVPSAGKRRWWRAGRHLLAGRSLSEGLFAEPAFDAAIARAAGARGWDASLVSASSLTPYQQLHGLVAKPRFVDLVDVDSQKWFDYADAAHGPKHWLYTLEGHRIRKLEREIAAWAKAVFIVSPSECQVFDGFTRAGAGTVATNGVDLGYFRPRPDVSTRPICAFVGALDYFPNIDAAIWFATDIWPAIRARHSDAEFHIIGRKPTAAVRRLEAFDGVKIVADVPDIRPHLAEAALVVCPIRVARGLQNKVLEAMAMAKPTLAAPAAIRAIRAEVGKELLSPTDEAEWIDAVGDLLDDPERRGELGLAARRFVETHHHWDRCLQPLVSAILAATCAKVSA